MNIAASSMTQPPAEILDEGVIALGLSITKTQRNSLLAYVALLQKWNKIYNLTAVREPEQMVKLHILDSLSVIPHVGKINSILDVGTGGGLPGIPLAILRPELAVTMLDTIAKKTAFVQQAIGELGLKNAIVVTDRVEKYAPPNKYDAIISRAFAELNDFVQGAEHLLADGGEMLAMKGVYPHDEIARLGSAMTVDRVIPLSVPSVEGQRHLVVLRRK